VTAARRLRPRLLLATARAIAQRRGFRPTAASCLTAVVLAAWVGLATASGPSDPFAYRRAAPLQLRELAAWNSGGVTIHDVSFASPKGGRVPAYVIVPTGRPPFAGLIIQHGLPGTRRDGLVYGEQFSRRGAVVVLIDAPFARRPGDPVHFDRRDRAEQIQLIVDLRRAVDLLRARSDVDRKRIGYIRISYGAAMGGLLAGVERRINAFVLARGDGGLVEHFPVATMLAALCLRCLRHGAGSGWRRCGRSNRFSCDRRPATRPGRGRWPARSSTSRVRVPPPSTSTPRRCRCGRW
jgi:hypothetical protein